MRSRPIVPNIRELRSEETFEEDRDQSPGARRLRQGYGARAGVEKADQSIPGPFVDIVKSESEGILGFAGHMGGYQANFRDLNKHVVARIGRRCIGEDGKRAAERGVSNGAVRPLIVGYEPGAGIKLNPKTSSPISRKAGFRTPGSRALAFGGFFSRSAGCLRADPAIFF